MSPATKQANRLNEKMEEASAALAAGDYFQCEQIAAKAMQAAFAKEDWESVARIAMPLQEARRQRRLLAIDANRIWVFEKSPPSGEEPLESGCYVICAPCVAADARRINEAGLEQGVPVIALACEPRTQLGLLPIAVVGSTTIRAKMKPVKTFTPKWCLQAIDALTQSALETFDPGRAVHRQVEDLVDKVMTLPDSELLHQKLAEVAHNAARVCGSKTRPARSASAVGKPRRGKAGHKGPRRIKREE